MSKVCSVGILLCVAFFSLWPWVVVGERALSHGQLQGAAWLSFITLALLTGVGPVVAGQYTARRLGWIA